MTFKDIDARDLDGLFRGLRKQINNVLYEYREFKPQIDQFVGYEMPSVFNGSISSIRDLMDYLTKGLLYLNRNQDKKFIILIDEYDKILMDASDIGGLYYEEINKVYRGFLNALFKDKSYLERGLLTGVLPIAANSVASAFNNAVIDTFFDRTYEDIFGFTYKELIMLTNLFALREERVQLIDRLKGYGSGKTILWNPWSVINYISDLRRQSPISNYWVNTGKAEWVAYKNKFRSEEELSLLTALLENKEIQMPLTKGLDFLEKNNTLLNFLNYAFYSGYLTFTEYDSTHASFAIPNQEVMEAWIANLNRLIEELPIELNWGEILGNLDESPDSERYLEQIFGELLANSTSYMDLPPENSYHMWILGLLSTIMKSHRVRSNLEAGDGRFDIAVTPLFEVSRTRNYIFELKRSTRERDLEADVTDAVQQVIDRNYAVHFDRKADLVIIGVAAFKTKIKIKISIQSKEDLYPDSSIIGRFKKF